MPFFQFIFASEAVPVSGKLEDDAKDAEELGIRLDQAKSEGKRLVTSSVITEQDVAEARREGVLEGDLPKVGDRIISGSFDPNDILHILAFDDLLEEADLEGEESEPEERVDPRILAGGNKNAKKK